MNLDEFRLINMTPDFVCVVTTFTTCSSGFHYFGEQTARAIGSDSCTYRHGTTDLSLCLSTPFQLLKSYTGGCVMLMDAELETMRARLKSLSRICFEEETNDGNYQEGNSASQLEPRTSRV